MYSWELSVSVLVGLISALLACILWKYTASKPSNLPKPQYTASKPFNLPKQQLKSQTPALQRTQVVQTSTGQFCRFSTAKVSGPGGDEPKDITNGTEASVGEKQELSMKEKFYLFLEKGFCPELEKGAEDPMSKHFGGANPHGQEGEKLLDLFCPFGGEEFMEDGENEGNGTNYGSRESQATQSDQFKKEVDTLEEMIKLGIKNGGQCPFRSMYPNDDEMESSDALEPSSNGESIVECPFKFALRSDADSEDEADLPQQHGKKTPCPLSKHNEVITEKPVSTEGRGDVKQSANTKLKLKDTLHAVQSTLSGDEFTKEEEIKEKQLAAIIGLLEQDNSATINPMEVQSQLKMYM